MVDTKNVLIIDDDRGHLKMLTSDLENSGYKVMTAPDGEAGLKIAKTKKPDLIILDVLLPGMKGRQVCVKLKEDNLTKDIPVIFLTAKDSPDDVLAEIQVGAVGHLTKPVNSKKLLIEVRNILGQKP